MNVREDVPAFQVKFVELLTPKLNPEIEIADDPREILRVPVVDVENAPSVIEKLPVAKVPWVMVNVFEDPMVSASDKIQLPEFSKFTSASVLPFVVMVCCVAEVETKAIIDPVVDA